MMIRKVSGQSLCSPCILKIPFRVAGYPETNELLPDNPFRTTAQLVSRPAIIVSELRSSPADLCPFAQPETRKSAGALDLLTK